MAMNNRDRLSRAFDLLSQGLQKPVDEVMGGLYGPGWNRQMAAQDAYKHGTAPREMAKQDVQTQLRAITEHGRDFNAILSRTHQAYASELREARNRWAHMDAFSSEDTIRALGTMELLLAAVNASEQAGEVRGLRDTLQRTVYENQTRKSSQRQSVMVDPAQGMKPWREVITPHRDVATGRYSASEFAANLYQVAVSREVCVPGNPYGDPVEFFNRTYLTEGLKDLLQRAIRRLVGDNTGSPVVNLQTNFGGGKTHSLLALYHLFGQTPVSALSSDVQTLVAGMGLPEAWQPGSIRRVAIVGNFLNAAAPNVKEDGTQVHTIWGELAWQLGGREAYDMIAENDRTGKPPAERLIALLKKYGPALILIDEWVAYAKQLVGETGLPAGTFDDQFVFAQLLTEAVALVDHCMLVVSIPASDSGHGSDIEVGGENGRQALHALQNVVRRKADQWRPSTKDESFEIVRKRLFEEPDAAMQAQIALTARKFMDTYRANAAMYPSAASGNDYERRIRASYPLHPELLDRLYEDWSSLENFQRTRGVLTLVSSIIHELWASNDTSPMILPGNVPLESESVNANLTQYLRDPWKPIIDADISGPESTAAKIDNDRPALGKRHLTQRIARTVFMGSAPRTGAQNPGIDEQAVRLGTTIPGDPEGNFGSALSMLEQRSTYFFNESGRYRYGLQASIGKTARDFADRLREDPDSVYNEIVRRLQPEGASGRRGLFRRVVVGPKGSESVPDVDEATLVIMHPKWSVGRGDSETTEAKQWIRDTIDRQGSSQRTNRNMLVFLAADKSMIGMVEDAARSYLGWKQVVDQVEQLNLTPSQARQAKESMDGFSHSIDERLRNAYVWCVYPTQPDPARAYLLDEQKIPDTGGDSMAQRTGSKLDAADQLDPYYAPENIGYEILPYLASAFKNGILPAEQAWRFMCQYPYLPRLTGRDVFNHALEQAASMPMTQGDRFAMAAGYDQDTGRFRTLVIPGVTPSERTLHVTDSTLIVDWDTATLAYIDEQQQAMQDATSRPTANATPVANDTGSNLEDVVCAHVATESRTVSQPQEPAAKRVYLGNIAVDPKFPSRTLGQINELILDQLRLTGADIRIDVHIQATRQEGFDENTIRIIEEGTAKLDDASATFDEE
ncbi:ATPase AAA [Bifidobacterium pseudolongum subsp. pseudolongum]|uniref:ATPase AAA n=1 Tax=Bifidobacterium pseudolongum subsp. pseudolongum TaxID=31954 RepID=A0A4Q5A4B1_9BIFI|nr:DUF499 domain-containing protein [Bifidobacterium pseudolongum]RYQ18544.1 ATPase AAA [Bifidobacterium pseudolongum subsp. pseudolongum]